jgi:tetratricopeptide (TPR) repeat protein
MMERFLDLFFTGARMLFHIAVTAAVLATPGTLQHQHHDAGSEKLGTVKFSTSCSEAAQPAFGRAMALLHSFEYAPAIEAFTAAAATDPGCAIAYWGIGVSRWGNPFAPGIKGTAAMEGGRTAIAKATAIGAKTERERDYINAAGRLFADFEKVDQRTRLLAYRDAMAQVAARYSNDPEASAFYALALAASADPTDLTYPSLLKAGAILERLAPAQPDHPGFVHYIIHAYDAPPLASRAVDAARRYAKIAPSAPHALHMPSHTFTRLGYWQDSIDTNIASAEAARREKSPSEELHAMDYQIYAYLQTAQDAAAKRLMDSLPDVSGRFAKATSASAAPPAAGAFAVTAIPARFALERRAWTEAASLTVEPSRFAHSDAMIWFAKALGAARTGDLTTARAAIDTLQQLRDRLAQAGESYWAEQLDIQRLGAAAWVSLKDGRTEEALATMRQAADREDKTEKSSVTPGPLAPAREQLGEMLLAVKQPELALVAFETTLKKEPNRYRALVGAADAARQTGDQAAMRRYYRTLLEVAAKAEAPLRPELVAAREALK